MGDYKGIINDTRDGKDLEANVISIYQLVLDGKLKRFPPKFWIGENSETHMAICIRYLIHNILGYPDYSKKDVITDEDYKILSKIKRNDFLNNKLGRLYIHKNECFLFSLLNMAYPNKFNLWKLQTPPAKYWNEKRAIEATKWLIKEYNLDTNTLHKTLTDKMFYENNLGTLFRDYYKFSIHRAVNTVLPNKFKAWEFNRVPRNYWNLDTSREATKWLVEEVLKLNKDTAFKYLRIQDFIDNNLGGMLTSQFNGSVYLALKNAYGDI